MLPIPPFIVGFLRGGCSRGGGNWGTLRIPREDWGTLGKIREPPPLGPPHINHNHLLGEPFQQPLIVGIQTVCWPCLAPKAPKVPHGVYRISYVSSMTKGPLVILLCI